MRFKKGDTAVVTQNNPCKAPLVKSDHVVIVEVTEYGTYLIRKFGELHSWEVDDSCLEPELPIGIQLELEMYGQKCDCGGYKTYQSMEPQYHSHTLPCSSLKGKNA